MRKIILTKTSHAWTRYLFAFLCTFVLGNTVANQVNAQVATNDYIVVLEVTDLSWDYPCGDVLPGITDECGLGQAEDGGDYGFVVAGHAYTLPEDFGPNTGTYVNDYNVGIALDDIVGFQVVNSGANLPASDFNPIFQAFENDCGDLLSNDTGILDCGVNADDSFVDAVLTVSWYNFVTVDAVTGQPVPGTYAIPFGGVSGGAGFDGGDGSTYDVAFSVTVLPVETPAPDDCGATFTFVGYECNNDQTDEDNATAYAMINIAQTPAGSNFEIVESVGVTFPFGSTIVPGGADLFIQVVEDEPWFVEFANADGCTLVYSDVLDLPDFDILGLGGNYCLSDPPNIIWENSIYESGNPVPGLPPATVPGTFTGLGIRNVVYYNNQTYYIEPFDFAAIPALPGDVIDESSMSGVAVFDPYIAGPGQHLISYIINNYGEIIGDSAYDDCYVAEDEIVNVYPNFYPTFPDATVCVTSDTILLMDPMTQTYIDQFDALETQFDPVNEITEADDYISFAGVGVTNNLDGTGTASFDPAVAGVGVHAVELTVGYPSCEQTYVVNITVVEDIVATIEDRTICASPSEAFDLTALFLDSSADPTTTPGGVFTLDSAVDANGDAVAATDISVSGDILTYDADGDNFDLTVTVTYTVGNDGDPTDDTCIGSDQATITIKDEHNDTFFDLPDHICVVDADGTAGFELSTFLTGDDVDASGAFTLVGGEAAGDAINGTVLTLANDAGDRFITVRWMQDNGTCATVVEETFEVVDPANPDPTVDLPSMVCEYDAAFFLTSPENGAPAGGTWTIGGFESVDGFFDPAALGVGDHEVTYCFTAPIPEFCEECASGTITVVEGPDPAFCVATDVTEGGLVGNQLVVTANECANEVCSTADDCFLLVPETTLPELLPTWDGLTGSGNDSAPDGTAVPTGLTSTVTIPDNALAANIYFDDLALDYDYAQIPLSATSQGDHNGYTITGPGGVVIVSVNDETDIDGNTGSGADNHFVNDIEIIVGGQLSDAVEASYAAAAAAAGFEGTATEYFFSLFEECEAVEFVYDLETNAAGSEINIEIVQVARAVDTQGDFAIFLHETGTDITDWALTFDAEPFDDAGNYSSTYGYYSFCTTNADLGIDLAAYDEVTVMFTTQSCDATNDDDMICENYHEEVVIVLESLDATLAPLSAPHCAGDGNLDLEALYEEGVTTQGGTWSVDNGILDGNYLVVDSIDFAGATSVDVEVTYWVGEGSLCDPTSQTMMVTIYSGDVAVLDFPETVCAGATYPLVAAGDITGTLPHTDNGDGTVTIDADASGLYTIIHTVPGTTCSYDQEVLVADANDLTTNDGMVCSNTTVNLTDFVSSQGGTFSGPAGSIVGNSFFPNTGGLVSPVTITYTIDGACGGTATFELTIIDGADAQFDLPGSVCPGETIDLAGYLVPNSTPGGVFAAAAPHEGTISGNTFTAPMEENINVTITYTVGSGDCEDVFSQVITVTSLAEAASVGTAFVCQSEDDFSIDLTEYIDEGIAFDPNDNTGGYFTLGAIRPFISEIEYDGSNDQEFVEITAPVGTDLSCYALFFYDRTDESDLSGAGNTPIDGGVGAGKSSGRVYGVIPLEGIVGTTQDDPNIGNVVAAQDYQYTDPWQGGVEGIDIIAEGPDGIMTDATGQGYAAIAFDPTWDILEGAAGIALVNICQAEDIDGNNVTATGGSYNDVDWDQYDYNHNDAVVQFIGYGIADNTNLGIFSSCDGPAAGMVSIDINVVDQDEEDRSLQFTNGCWVVPNIDDAELDYQDGGDYDNDAFDSDAVGQDGGHDGNAGVINWGLTEEGGDEFYYDYIAPDGDILDLDRLCWSLFAVNQIQGDSYEDNPLEEAGVDNENADPDGLDEGLVKFNCTNPTYTVPFGYQTVNACGSSAAAPFSLVVLMDIEEDWHAPKEPICSSEAPFSLTDLINDEVHYIQPYHYEGSFDVTHTETFTENVKPPAITEIHYRWYEYNEDASDDHCILYNYVDDNETPFNNEDDAYEQAWICEGVEISAPIGTDLSCYQLVVYSNHVDADSLSCSNALAHDVAWINEDGELVEQDVTNDVFIDLYGSVNDDDFGAAIPDGHLMYVPTWEYYEWQTASEIDGYPYYDGINPAQDDNEGWYAVSNQPATTGIYVDVDGDFRFDPDIDAGPFAPNTFPWDRDDDCFTGVDENTTAGSRWFPILNLPDTIGGIGLINKCNGEKIDFLSWGGKLCVESEEDFSEAGPFEQLTSNPIDTTQNSLIGDLRSIQLMSCSELPGFPTDCAACGDDGTVWALVYNGGNVSVPACDYEFGGNDEIFDFSNSIGHYNCYLDTDYFVPAPLDAFDLDLTSLLQNNTTGLDANGYTYTGILPNNAIITSHTVEVEIGTGNSGDFQVYTFLINADNCGNAWDENDNTTLDCGSDNYCIAGEYIDLGLSADDNNGGDQDVGDDGLYEETFGDGNGENTPDNDCYIGECTSEGKTVYNVSNLSAYIYGGEVTENDPSPPCGGAASDTCQALVKTPETYTVTMTVTIDYMQCVPTGNFHTSLDAQTPAPLFGANLTDGPITMNTTDWDDPWWQMDPSGLADIDIDVTYDVTNYHPIEADDATDDLACLDDDNDNIRSQEIEIVSGNTTVDVSGIPAAVCAGENVALPGGATWSGTGVTGSNFMMGMPGDYTINYTTGGSCAASGSVTITVNANDVAPTGIPANVACGASVDLPADATWTGTGVTGSTFSSTTPGAYSLDYTTTGTCATSGTVSITVDGATPLDTSGIPGSIDCGGSATLTAGATWSGNGVTGDTFSSTTPGSYVLNYVADGPCGDTGSVTIIVNAGDVLDTSGIPDSIDCGGSATLTAGATWTGSGVTGDTFSSTTPGSYVLNYVADGPCGDTGSVTIIVNGGTTIDVSGIPGSIDCGGSATLTAGATWTGDGVSGLTFTSTTPGLYNLSYVGDGPCGDTGSVSILVNDGPDYDTSGVPASVCVGESVTLPTGASWSGNGVSGGTFSASSAGSYSIDYAADGPCGETGSVTINVSDNATLDTSSIPDSACAGETVGLPGGASWSGDGVAGSLFSNTAPGSYTLTWTIGGECGGTGTHTITVVAGDVVDVTPFPIVIDCGETITLPSGATWTGNGVSGNTFSSTTPGNYSLSYTTTGGCSSSGTVSVTVNAPTPFNPGGSIPASACVGESVPLPAGATWSGNGVTGNTFVGASAGSYTLSYDTGGACAQTGSVIINVAANGTIDVSGIPDNVCAGETVGLPGGATWSGNGVSGSLFSSNTAGSYTLTWTIAGACGGTGTVTIGVTATDTIDTNSIASSVACGGSITLPSANWTGNGVTGNTFSSTTPGFYNLNYTTTGACPISGTVGINVTAPTPYNPTVASVACVGETVSLPAGATWSGNGVSGNNFVGATPGVYTINYDTGGDCAQTGTRTITVQDSTDINLAGIPASVCSFNPITLPTANWSGTGVSGTVFIPPGPGSYTLSYDTGGDCGDTGSVTIQVIAPISVNNNATDSSNDGFYSVTLDMTGGTNSYTVNGNPVSGVQYVTDVPCGSPYTFIVGSGGLCNDVTVTGNFTCAPPACIAEAGNLNVNLPGSGELFCTTIGIQMTTSGNNTSANTIFALSDPDTGNVEYLNEGGFFTAVPGGTYNAWVVNTCGPLGEVPGNAGAIASLAGSDEGFDVDGPIMIQVAPELTLDLIAFCDDSAGGYLIQVEVAGGAPAITGFGSYSLNFPFFSGTLTGTPPLTAVISDVSGMPFPGGVTIAVSVDSDGSLCEVTETVVVPTTACGIDGEMDDELTLADTPITFEVTDNDDGMDIQITGFTQPQNGTVTLNPDGTFTYVPNTGFFGEDQFVYEITDAIGQSITVPVIVFVQEPDVTVIEDLSVVDYVDCSGSGSTGTYTLVVTINGGVAPYTISSPVYNDVLNEAGSIQVIIPDGNPYLLAVTDAAQTTIEVGQDDVACTKVSVELLTFDGSVETDGDLLKWVSASELNNSHYILEHSTDGDNYNVIDVAEGAGTTSTVSNYSFLNKDAEAGINYYRLFAVDFDGTTVYHGTVTLVRGESGLGFVNIYPVPASTVVNVTYSSIKTTAVAFEIYNVAGKLIDTATVDANQGANQTSFNVSTYPVGTYFISINDGDSVSTTRFVVE